MNDLEGSISFTSFHELCGITVRVDDVINEISQHSLDAILGFLAGLSLEIIKEKNDLSDSHLQGVYLQKAIVDDFPKNMPNAYRMYIPGRVPITKGRPVFVHEQNIAWLCNAALLYSKEEHVTHEIGHNFSCRMFRLLLIINDFLSTESTYKIYNLKNRRVFALNWLRHGQFNRLFGESFEILAKLARQKIILLDILPEYYTGIEDLFFNASGVSLLSYFYVISLLVTHFYEGMNKGNHWLSESSITTNIKNNEKDLKKVISDWKRNPTQYRDAYHLWMENSQEQLPIYDFVPLRERPLIEGRPGELVCPVPSFLFSKIEDGPFYVLSDYLNGPELNRFHIALGKAYEDYAHQLIENIANRDITGTWSIARNPKVKRKGELTDSYLQRNEVAISFEHKGQRPGTEFLRGRQSDRVLGPSEICIEKLENNEPVNYIEGAKYDKGFITRGMWQQSKKGFEIVRWAKKKFGYKPNRMFPVITLFSSLVVDTVVRRAYLNPLIEKAKLYSEDFWKNPQWINIADLESLSQIADDGKLDLEAIFSEKLSKSINERFDMYLSSKNFRVLNGWVHSEMVEMLDQSCMYFFGKKLQRRTSEHV